MTEQEPYEKMLDKFEDLRKEIRQNFLKMLAIMVAALGLIAIGGKMSLDPLINAMEKSREEIVELKVEQGVKKERDRFIQNTQATEIVNLIEACGKKKYICKE